MKIILVDGRLTKEKLAQILKRHAPRRRKEPKTTLADVWPGKEEEDGKVGGGTSPSQSP